MLGEWLGVEWGWMKSEIGEEHIPAKHVCYTSGEKINLIFHDKENAIIFFYLWKKFKIWFFHDKPEPAARLLRISVFTCLQKLRILLGRKKAATEKDFARQRSTKKQATFEVVLVGETFVMARFHGGYGSRAGKILPAHIHFCWVLK